MINFEDVNFQYQDRTILRDLNFFVPQGSFHFVTGPSGSGKSTFLGLCGLDLQPSHGRLEHFGTDCRALSRSQITDMRRLIGVVPQNPLFINHLSLFDNVLLPIVAAGLDPKDEIDNVKQLLDWVGLSDRADARPDELSGGEKQRGALARAVIMSPDLILADEPTGNLEWEMGQRLMALLMQLNSLGKTVLIATHDLNIIRSTKSKIETRILRINQSRIEIAGANL